MKAGWCIALVVALAGCGSIGPARMVQPAGLEARTVEVTVDGMSGGTRGSFQVAGNTGRYSRAASRLDLFDELLAFDKGGAEFTVRGADFPEPVTARCGFRQTTSTIRIVEFTPKKFSYECSYEGQPGLRFVLQEAAPASGVRTLKTERHGEFMTSGRVYSVRSVHDAVGGIVPLGAPLGYVVDTAGTPIASVELNGLTPALRLPSSPATPGERRDVLLIALSLAVLWDPAAR
jgi:hypothetical protein